MSRASIFLTKFRAMCSYMNKAMDFLVGIGLLKYSIEKLRQNAARGRSGILRKSSNVFDGGLKSVFLQMLKEDWIIRVTNSIQIKLVLDEMFTHFLFVLFINRHCGKAPRLATLKFLFLMILFVF